MKSTSKKKFIRLLVLFFMLVVVGFVVYKVFFIVDKQIEQQQLMEHEFQVRLSPKQIASLEEGDIILRRGYGFFSDYISKYLNSPPYEVTHAGIIVRENDDLFVIHSLSSDVAAVDGVQLSSLQDFLNTSYPEKLIVTRVKNHSKEVCSQVAQKALYYLKLKIPFDHRGDFEDGTSLYCTELIWRILEKDLKLVQIPLTVKERKTHFHRMEAMYDTIYFDRIIDQYILHE